MMDASLLDAVLAEATAHAADPDEELRASLRQAFPGIHISICSDDDVPSRVPHGAGNEQFRLYFVQSGGHCVTFTNESESATGLVVARVDQDD